jgi:replicative DNA helicase|tara:strand:+ start:660 stop:2033 length:1374 start_codon:yes stop_codon:yes gene_type:complete
MTDRNFGYLGDKFQLKLLSLLIVDSKFADNIVESIEPTYFDDQYCRLLMQLIKEYYTKYETVPTHDSLDQLIRIEVANETAKEYLKDTLKKLKDQDFADAEFTQQTALKFCKQQEIKKAISNSEKIMANGNFEDYDKIEDLFRKALSVGNDKEDGIDVFNSLDDVLSSDFRHPVATGITGIDNITNGGLSKGELGVVLAPFGVGKSTVLTKFANTAYNLGHNVVQIIFEDNPKVIQRKHISCWTGIELNDLSDRKEEVKEKLKPFKQDRGNLIIKKMASDGTTVAKIKHYVRKLITRGIKPDVIILDYIDCVVPSRQFNDEYAGEGNVMREFETLVHEFDMVGWTAVQGNRSSIGADVVEAHQIGGSIKKGQIGHFIMSIAKTLEQKESGRATIAVLKSRFGKDGVIFEDCVFDNGKVYIDTDDQVSFLGFEGVKQEKKANRVLDAIQKRNEKLNNN